MNLPTPTKNDIEAAKKLAHSIYGYLGDGGTHQRIFINGVLAGKMEERALALKLVEALTYFVERCEGIHPDGYIRSRKTYGLFKDGIESYKQATGIGEQEEGKT